MKSLSHFVFVLPLALAMVLPVAAQIRKAPTVAEATAKRRQVDAVYERSEVRSVENEVSIERAKPSLLGSSDYLIGPHGFSLIPKGSVVAQGKMLTLATTAPTKGKLLKWEDFFRRHRAGIRLLTITDQQWMGEASLEPLRIKLAAAEKSGFTTLTSLNGDLVALQGLKKLSQSDS
jgi:hypothetical protein